MLLVGVEPSGLKFITKPLITGLVDPIKILKKYLMLDY